MWDAVLIRKSADEILPLRFQSIDRVVMSSYSTVQGGLNWLSLNAVPYSSTVQRSSDMARVIILLSLADGNEEDLILGGFVTEIMLRSHRVQYLRIKSRFENFLGDGTMKVQRIRRICTVQYSSAYQSFVQAGIVK